MNGNRKETKHPKASLINFATNTNCIKDEDENLNEYLSFGRNLFKNKDLVINESDLKKTKSFDESDFNESDFNGFIQSDSHAVQSFRKNTPSPSYSPIEIESSQSETEQKAEPENDSDMELAFRYVEKIEQEYCTKKKQIISASDDDCIEIDVQEESMNKLTCFIPNKIEKKSIDQQAFACSDQPMQISDDESSQEEEKGNLFHLDLLFESFNLIDTILTVVELVDLMASQVSHEFNKNYSKKITITTKINEQKNEPDKAVCQTKNIQPKISTEEKKPCLFKETTNQSSHSVCGVKISYLNNGPETELFKTIESVLLAASKTAYENLNDALKNSYKYEQLTTDICQFMFNQQVKHIENDKLRELKIYKLRWYSKRLIFFLFIVVVCFQIDFYSKNKASSFIHLYRITSFVMELWLGNDDSLAHRL